MENAETVTTTTGTIGTAADDTQVAATSKKKAAPKKDTPSDKAVIAQLKKELAQEKAAVVKLSEELDIQQRKNEHLFKKYQESQEALGSERQKFVNSKSALMQTIDGALRAFANS